MHLGANISHANVHAAKNVQFADIRCRGNVKAFAPKVKCAVSTSQIGRQAAVHSSVDYFGGLDKHEFANVGKGESEMVHGVSDGEGLEVSGMVDFTCKR